MFRAFRPSFALLRARLDASVAHRISVAAVALTLLFVSLVSAITYGFNFYLVRESVRVEIEDKVGLATERLSMRLSAMVKQLQNLARNPLFVSGVLDTGNREVYLRPFLSQYDPFSTRPTALCIMDYRGSAIACSGPAAHRLSSAAVLKAIATTSPQAEIDESGDDATLEIAFPIVFEQTGKAEGALAASFSLKALLAAETGFIGPSYGLRLKSDTSPDVVSRGARETVQAERRIDVPPPVRHLGLALQLGAPESGELKPLAILTLIYIGLGAVIAPFALALARRLGSHLTSRLARLTERAEQVAATGAFDFPSDPGGHDEVARLSGAFERMVERLREANAALEARVDERTRELSEAKRRLQESEERLQLALTGSDAGLWDWDVGAGEVYCSAAAAQIMGLGTERGKHPHAEWERSVHPDDRKRVLETLREHLAGQVAQYYTEYRIGDDGGNGWVCMRGRVSARDEAGRPLRLVGTATDISERKAAEERLLMAGLVMETAAEGILITDARARVVMINPAFQEITGYSAAEVLGKQPDILRSGLQQSGFYGRLWRTLVKTGRWQGELWNRRKNGDLYAQRLSICAIRDESQRVRQYLGVFSDVTLEKHHAERLRHQADHDELTGLPNRRLFLDRAEQAIARAERNGEQLALLMIDLDGFKQVNDSLGHRFGDLLLQQTGQRLLSCVRESDTVARLGGDEYMVLLQDIASPPDAQTVASKILTEVQKPYVLGNKETFVSASVGIALYPHNGASAEALIGSADTAMYEAKGEGKNTSRFITDEMQQRAVRCMQLEGDLRRAVQHGQFVLHYQPVVELATGRVVKAEALVRWLHPARGLVHPEEFIRAAERTGVIGDIGEWVLGEAVKQLLRWDALVSPDFEMSINLSPRQCLHGDLVDLVCRASGGRSLDSRLVLEITESLFLDAAEGTVSELEQLRRSGVRIAIDDFGTGYSCLSYLNKLPVDILKVDRSFVQDIPESAESLALVGAILTLGDTLGFQVIAEGVETEAQARFLREAGCRWAQGYLFSQPLAAAEFERRFLAPRDCPALASLL